MFCENMIHCLSAKDKWRHKIVQGSSFFGGKIYALTALMLGVLVRRVCILSPIVILVMSAGVVGTAIADIRRLFQGRAYKRRKSSIVFCSPGEYASDRFSAGVDNVTHEAVHQFNKQGRKGIKTTKENISKVKEKIPKRKAAAEQPKKQAEKQAVRQERGAIKTLDRGKKNIKTVDRSRKTIKQASSTVKGSVKTTRKSIKTAEKTAKASIKTSQQAAKAAQRTAQATARAARAAAQAARVAARTAVAAAKAAVKATVAAVKAIIAATKALIAAIAAGGWIVVLIIVVICLIGMLIGSCFGIFFSGEDSGTGQTMQTAVQEINTDYQENLDEIKASHSYDVLEMFGSRAVWKLIVAIPTVRSAAEYSSVSCRTPFYKDSYCIV